MKRESVHTDNRFRIEPVVVGYLFKERETFFDDPSRRNKESYRAWRRTCDEGRSIFPPSAGQPSHWLTFFARRSTLVARALGEMRIGWTRRWVWVEGRDRTRRYST